MVLFSSRVEINEVFDTFCSTTSVAGHGVDLPVAADLPPASVFVDQTNEPTQFTEQILTEEINESTNHINSSQV